MSLVDGVFAATLYGPKLAYALRGTDKEYLTPREACKLIGVTYNENGHNPAVQLAMYYIGCQRVSKQRWKLPHPDTPYWILYMDNLDQFERLH